MYPLIHVPHHYVEKTNLQRSAEEKNSKENQHLLNNI